MKYGFIGAGNMASAIVKGVLKTKVAIPFEILIYDINPDISDNLSKQTGVICASSNSELINESDCIVLCIKPNVLPNFLVEYKNVIEAKNPLIISIAAGISVAAVENILDYGARFVRVMPNINAEVLEAMSCLCFNRNIIEADKNIVEKIFNSIGKTIEIDEKYISVFSGIAGCSPAFTYLFIESLAKAAHKHGLNKNDAIKIAAQAVYGSAKMILESREHPNTLIDKVCSPGGTTIEGICKLDDRGFQSTVVHAVEATIIKDTMINTNSF